MKLFLPVIVPFAGVDHVNVRIGLTESRTTTLYVPDVVPTDILAMTGVKYVEAHVNPIWN